MLTSARLQGISGAFRPETLTALMGVTGVPSLPVARPARPCAELTCMLRRHDTTARSLTRRVAGAGKTTLMDVLAGRKTGAPAELNQGICFTTWAPESMAR